MMGTLYNQRPRAETLNLYVSDIVRAAERLFPGKTEVAGDLTPDEWRAAAEVVKAALAIQSADVLDEQLAGFGELIEEVAIAVKDLFEDGRYGHADLRRQGRDARKRNAAEFEAEAQRQGMSVGKHRGA